MNINSRIAILAAVAAAAGCSRTASMIPSPTPVATVPSTSSSTAPAAATLPNDVRWFRQSAEYRALARQAYRVAGDRLPELTRGLAPRGWAVILDADETMLDNSEYERRLAVTHANYSDASWAAWVDERAAPPVPGGPEFTRRVHALGGRVVIVTNRAENLCAATRDNFVRDSIETDLVLCQPGKESDKNPRFQRVENGTAAPGIPALTVMEWLGDNILDFPNLSQAARHDPAALADFGRKYFILPNPMYGSWTSNTEP